MNFIPKSVMALFLGLLIGAPLAFGTTELWSFLILQGLCLLAFSLLLIQSLKGREPFLKVPGGVMLILLGGYFLLQMMPLPPAALRVVSPEAWRRYGETVWVLTPGVWMPLSVNLKSTCMEFARFWTYGVFYLLAVQILSERSRLKTVVQTVGIFTAGYALLGVLQYLRPTGRIFWFLRDWPAYAPHHFATYVNGNHYAGLMEMVLPVAFCLFLATRPLVSYGSWRERLVATVGNPGGNRHVLFGGAALLVATSIFLSLSRGGILSTLATLFALSLFLLLRRNDRKAGAWLLLLIMGTLLTVGAFGWEPIFARFERMRTAKGQIADERLVFWKDSVELMRHYPVTGTGFGTFIDAYPTVKTSKTKMTVDHAHNDYVELATDGGLVALFLVAGLHGMVFKKVIPAWRRRRSRFSSAMVLGSLAGIAAIGLHSITDFNLHIGANTLYYVWLLALAVAASHNRSGGGSPSELSPTSLRRTLSLGAILTLGLAAAILFNLGVLAAQIRFDSVEKVNLAETQTLRERENLRNVAVFAARLDPFESRYHYALANADLALGYITRGLENYAQALRFGLVRGEFLERMGLVYAHLNRPLRARQLLSAAVSADISDPKRLLTLADFLLWQQEPEAAFEITRRALRLAPEQTRNFLRLLSLHPLEDEAMLQAFPEISQVFLGYGDYLAERGEPEKAEEAYRHALYLFATEEQPSLQVIWGLRTYYSRGKRYEEALQVVQAGLNRWPDNAALHRTAGEIYERLGIFYRAMEEYRHALLYEPRHQGTRKRLEALTKEP